MTFSVFLFCHPYDGKVIGVQLLYLANCVSDLIADRFHDLISILLSTLRTHPVVSNQNQIASLLLSFSPVPFWNCSTFCSQRFISSEGAWKHWLWNFIDVLVEIHVLSKRILWNREGSESSVFLYCKQKYLQSKFI
jgi:hypothetical protein